MNVWLARSLAKLPGSRWLPMQVARIRASIHTKLLVAFFSIVVLLIALAAVGLGGLQSADERAADLVRLERRIAAYRQLQHNATEQLYAVASAFLAADERQLGAALRRLQRFAYDFDRAEFVARDQEDIELLRGIEADYAELIGTGTQVIELVRAGRLVEARALHHERSVPLANQLERHTFTLVNKAEADMVERAELSSQEYRTSQVTVIAVSLGAILLALVLGYAISTSLIEPVRGIRARLRNIARGDFSGQLEVPNRDELGSLAENVNRMSRKLDRLYGEIEAANRHKSAFLANMSHELRTPMNAIIGFNRLVMRRCKDVLPEKHYENLGKIAVSADHLLMLINTVLDLSKIEAGRVEVHPTEFELAPLLEGCVRTAEPLVDGKVVEFVKNVGPALPTMHTDQDKVRQIVLNLLSNAAKFTEQGRIALAATSENGDISVSVSDTGIGIPENQLPHIFEEFTQVDASTTRKHSGTGLGLAISQRLATLLGGSIDVESKLGAGSTFTVMIPAQYRESHPDEGELTDEDAPAEEQTAS
jgi:signal transduction histidine kinase